MAKLQKRKIVYTLVPAVVFTTFFTLGVLKDNFHSTKTFASPNYEQIPTKHTHTHTQSITSMVFVCKGTFRERASFLCEALSMAVVFCNAAVPLNRSS